MQARSSSEALDSIQPKVELWKSAVCKDVPPLQPGEHMTVGQVSSCSIASQLQVWPHTPGLQPLNRRAAHLV